MAVRHSRPVIVIPAQAGIHTPPAPVRSVWVPASAGTTGLVPSEYRIRCSARSPAGVSTDAISLIGVTNRGY